MPPLDRLSPSKINAFRDCPQHFAFRYVERLPEPEDPVMLRGSLVHLVCERLFEAQPRQRTRLRAVALLHRLWEQLADEHRELADLFDDAEAVGLWLASAERLLSIWFGLERPDALDVRSRELYVETATDDGVLAGIIDRLDRLDDGTFRITDYKTGPAPSPGWERASFFQLRFYALVASRALGIAVSRLRLVHLGGGGEVLELPCDGDALEATSRQVQSLATAMRRCLDRSRWATNVGRRCDWCAFRSRCPAWRSDGGRRLS